MEKGKRKVETMKNKYFNIRGKKRERINMGKLDEKKGKN
jgi:hypothetical protein